MWQCCFGLARMNVIGLQHNGLKVQQPAQSASVRLPDGTVYRLLCVEVRMVYCCSKSQSNSSVCDATAL